MRPHFPFVEPWTASETERPIIPCVRQWWPLAKMRLRSPKNRFNAIYFPTFYYTSWEWEMGRGYALESIRGLQKCCELTQLATLQKTIWIPHSTFVTECTEVIRATDL